MAFTYINTAFKDSAGSPTLTINKPTNTSEGDIMFAFLCMFAYNYPNSVPTGWTLLQKNYGGSYCSLYYKIVTSSEPSSYSWGWELSSKCSGIISTFRGGFDKNNPINTSSNGTYTTSNTTIRASSMNVSKSNCPLIFMCSIYNNSSADYTPPTNPTGWSEKFDNGGSAGDYYYEVCSMIWSSSGSTGNIDATASVSTEGKQAFAIALNPEQSGPANLKSYNTNLKANIKSINTNLIANVKSLDTNV